MEKIGEERKRVKTKREQREKRGEMRQGKERRNNSKGDSHITWAGVLASHFKKNH